MVNDMCYNGHFFPKECASCLDLRYQMKLSEFASIPFNVQDFEDKFCNPCGTLRRYNADSGLAVCSKCYWSGSSGSSEGCWADRAATLVMFSLLKRAFPCQGGDSNG